MGRSLNTQGELLDYLKTILFKYQPRAVESLRRNHHMNDITDKTVIDPKVVDAALVDFINFVGACGGVDYAMYTSDLPSPGPLDRIAEASSE